MFINDLKMQTPTVQILAPFQVPNNNSCGGPPMLQMQSTLIHFAPTKSMQKVCF